MSKHTYIHRNGFTQLSTPASGSCVVNIIFVHGLRGGAQTTWEDTSTEKGKHVALKKEHKILERILRLKSLVSTSAICGDDEADEEDDSENHGASSKEQRIFWPRDYLAKDFPRARVWTYGYNADVIGVFQPNNKSNISQHGNDFAVRIRRDIQGRGFHEPIIFIAHSLGGIIVKDAIWRSDPCSSQTKLIIFLGTPHRGSAMAGWGTIALNLATLALQDSNKRISRGLRVDSEVLDIIHTQFTNRVAEKGIMINSFQEARGISGVAGLQGKVVDDFSSKLGLPETQEEVETIDADHMQMARCSKKTDQLYEIISGVIKGFIAEGLQRSVPQSVSGSSFYHIPHFRNELFAGREQILEEIENRFFVKKQRKLAVLGLGGIGKTQLALEFAYRVQDRRPEYSVFWVLAQSQATFEQSYAGLAKLLQISGGEDQKMLVKQHLSSENAGKWLLIVDNADDHEASFRSNDSTGMMGYLPRNDHGLTLFTTRSREVAVDAATNNVMDLGEMNPEEATSLFKTHSINHPCQDETAIGELVKELTYLPLAIVQAASYMSKNMMSVKKYLGLLRGEERNVVELMKRDFYDDTLDTTKAVLKTWIVSFEQILQRDPIAADIFSFMACLGPKAIPQSLLSAQQPEVDFEHAIGTLLGYTFITRQENGSTFDMHRLVHMAIRAWLQDHDLERIRINAITYLSSILSLYDLTDNKIWRGSIPHVLRLLYESKGCRSKERYKLCYNVGAYLTHLGRLGEAIKVLSESLACRKEHKFQDDIPEYSLEYHLANAYNRVGRFQDAIKLLEPAVVVGDESFVQVSMQFMLADAYKGTNQVERAIKMCEHIAAIQETPPEGRTGQFIIAFQRAIALSFSGRIEDAIKIFKQIIPIERGVLGEDHISLLIVEQVLANTYCQNGQFGEAVSIFERITPILREKLAEDDLFHLDVQFRRARVYIRANRVKEAIELYEHVRAVHKKTLAEDDIKLLELGEDLAHAYCINKQFEKAIWLYEHVRTVRMKTLAEDDEWLLALEHNLGSAYAENGQLEEGIDLLKHIVAIRTTLPQDDFSRLKSEQVLASAYIKSGEIENAIEILERVVAVLLSTTVDEDDELLIYPRELLAKAYGKR
ncbi:hypothetical protein F4814DRAFT_460095 [Daldinia grandis]|nr:hypothetical protein F4814DRAFT_460095 [Daldinia grandis]